MKLLWGDKDGGPESNVRCWGIEIKGLFSVLLLRFGYRSRNAYHSHAFGSVSWLLSGGLLEWSVIGIGRFHSPGFWPIFTGRDTFHKVEGLTDGNWVFTLRGPWSKTWREKRPLEGGREVVLSSGRVEVGTNWRHSER